ncbi:Trypsin [Popillia japonica]|uniref:Trypsin n=1 Tax=Popillia japonica TaxID=7064 RepID=A0AAW1N0A3_POPJA
MPDRFVRNIWRHQHRLLVRGKHQNARPICPEHLATSAPPLSSRQASDEDTIELTVNSTRLIHTTRLSGGNVASSPNEDEDFFPGDFAGFKIKNAKSRSDIACGTVAVQPSPLITNGQKARPGEYPWHVALYHARDGDANYTCGGSLISRYHVLTAAHCVSKPISQKLLDPENVLVQLGKYYLRKSTPGMQTHKVSKITRHPQYESLKYAHDVAVIRLAQPANFTNFVRPVCLWEGSGDINHLLGKFGTVVGWGYDETGKLTDELTMLNMPVVSKEVCIYSLPDFYPRFTTIETYCAGFTNGSSACNGDSGGGMVFQRNTGNPEKKAYHLRGLISLSVALQNEAKCNPTHYVVFTDVAKYLGFIKQAMAE